MTAAAPPRPVLAVTGLAAEARIVAPGRDACVVGGGDAARLARLLQARLDAGNVAAVLSFGIAGGLAPGLRPGRVVVAEAVADGTTRWPADPAWQAALRAACPDAAAGVIAGVDEPVADQAGKAALHGRADALAVDMESHVAARLAAAFRLPFAALRVVADPAGRTLPRAALVGMRPDGSTDVAAVLAALARRPGELPGLIRTAMDAGSAFRSLRRCRAQVGEGFAYGG